MLCSLSVMLGTFKMPPQRQQQERQQNNRLNRQNNNYSAPVSRFFVQFFNITARLQQENA